MSRTPYQSQSRSSRRDRDRHATAPPWRRRRPVLPGLEALEGRASLSALVVTSSLDSPTPGSGSLRATIAAAPAGSTIVFAKNVHKITLTGGELHVTKGLDIEGPGADRLTVSGNHAGRLFEVDGGATVTLAGMTVADGRTTATGKDGGAHGGGGILCDPGATLNLNRCAVVNNTAIAGAGLDVFGGGLLNLGTANVTSSTFAGDKALGGAGPTFFEGSQGGAIDNFGGATLTVAGCTFSGNQAFGGAGAFGIGGAIENNAGFDNDRPSTAGISGSVFTDNIAAGDTGSTGNGGAIDNEGIGATMTLAGSLLTGNQSVGGDASAALGGQGLGGAILNFLGSVLTVHDTTFAGNKAIGGDGGTPTADNPQIDVGAGGGIYNVDANLNVSGSLFVGNQARGGTTTLGPGGNATGGAIIDVGIPGVGPGVLSLTDSTLLDNLAVAGSGGTTPSDLALGLAAGGGLDVSFSSTAVVTGCLILGNQALGGSGSHGIDGGDALGGGISVGINQVLGFTDDSALTLTDSLVAGNLARGGDGGAGADGGDALGGGIWFGLPLDTAPANTLDDSLIVLNTAQGGSAGKHGTAGHGIGGGLFITPGAVVLTTGTLVKWNHASTGHDDTGH